ncbi:MAG TPA: AsmA-like C-terminal region-containing protein [Burkholderiales bacterium]|nr:AsmA-like C-terminal region-containing protein [Burkholderiales bacterium]
MNRKTVFTKTAKGLMEAAGKTTLVGRELRDVLTHIDGKATVGDLETKLTLPAAKLNAHIATLVREGLAREFVIAPDSISPPSQMSMQSNSLDFGAYIPSEDGHAAEMQKAEVDALAREILAVAKARDHREMAGTAAESLPPTSPNPPQHSPDALREAEARVRAQAEKVRREAAERAEREAAERARAQQEDTQTVEEGRQRAIRESEERVRRAKQERTRREREEREREIAARREAEAQAQAEETERVRRESAERARQESVERERKRREAGEIARAEAAEKARAEEAAIKAAEEKARREAEEKARLQAAAQAKQAEQDIRRKAKDEERAKARAHAETAARARKEERAREIAEAEARAAARVKERERESAVVASRLENLRQGRTAGNAGRRIGLSLVMLAVLAVLALPLVPVDVSRFEMIASAQIGAPVQVGNGSYALFPQPHLRLSEVRVGNARIDELRAMPQLASLWSDIPTFRVIELQGVTAKAEFLGAMLWGRIGGDTVLPERIKFEGVQLTDTPLPALRGAMSTGATGLRVMDLYDASGESHAHLTREGERAVFELRLKNAQGLLAMPFALADFNARGTVDAQGMDIAGFDAGVYDGVLKGKGRLIWTKGWRFDGDIEAVQIDVARFAKLFEGRLRGSGQISMVAEDWQQLSQSFKLGGNFEIEKGRLSTLDLVRSLRESQLAAGQTPFVRLEGQAVAEAGKVHLRNLRLDATVLTASGNAELVNQEVSGRMNAEMRTPAGPIRNQFSLSGNTTLIKVLP